MCTPFIILIPSSFMMGNGRGAEKYVAVVVNVIIVVIGWLTVMINWVYSLVRSILIISYLYHHYSIFPSALFVISIFIIQCFYLCYSIFPSFDISNTFIRYFHLHYSIFTFHNHYYHYRHRMIISSIRFMPMDAADTSLLLHSVSCC